MSTFERVCSGVPGFDRAVDCIRMGDNVVWQVSELGAYEYFARNFAAQSIAEHRNLTYVRFAEHPPLLEPVPGLKIVEFDPESGFENFTVKVHELITREGRDAFYIFDSLSDLQSAWASDWMMGNFFRVTCPYLFELNTVAFFGILRDRHAFDTVARIRDTTQLLLDVYGRDAAAGGGFYVHPLKVWNRYSGTMFMPHCLDCTGEAATPLTDAVAAGEFYRMLNERQSRPEANCALDSFERLFLAARQAWERGEATQEWRKKLAAILLGRDERIQHLAEQEFSIADLLEVKSRMIGSGSIGGKAAGVLLSRKIVANHCPALQSRIEPHDSFYIGTDVFYSFLVHNNWWKLRLAQRTHDGFFSAGAELHDKIMEGEFPESLQEQLRRMLDYFAQSPMIVRSSSLLEDGFGNAFAGKYESVFCVNATDPEHRLLELEQAIRQVYASSMDESALTYRRRRNLDDRDEQMALLVQRVSGSLAGDFFLPTAAGVGYSWNSYVWNDAIDPAAGMVRIVGGLGTRAVDRTESDYPRVAALNVPQLSVLTSEQDKAKYAQHCFDVLDLKQNRLREATMDEVFRRLPVSSCKLLGEHDTEAERFYRDRGESRDVWYCNCGKILEQKSFVDDLKQMLHTLQQVYDYPVDIEFTVNFAKNGQYLINLLQCRPLQIRGRTARVPLPEKLAAEQLFFALEGDTMGGGADWKLDYVISVDPKIYMNLPLVKKYQTARAVGFLTRLLAEPNCVPVLAHRDAVPGTPRIMLLGPGRWGTSSPELGVPVNFAEISAVSALCELSLTEGEILPELSFGSHFFQDLVESNMFYAALFLERPGCQYHRELLDSAENIASALLPASMSDMSKVIQVYAVRKLQMVLQADTLSRKSVCYRQNISL